jgi:hypothetical protein
MNTNTIQKNSKVISSFFPRIIREFNDGPDEKPMMYGERY